MTKAAVEVRRCGPAELGQVCELLAEYWASFGFSGDFQGFDVEIRTLPGRYAPPGGRILLASVGDETAGCIASRRLNRYEVEAKRLYVRPAFRGYGVGLALLTRLIEEVRAQGCRRLLADTMPQMGAALSLYTSRGFMLRGPYGPKPTPGAIYLQLDLANAAPGVPLALGALRP